MLSCCMIYNLLTGYKSYSKLAVYILACSSFVPWLGLYPGGCRCLQPLPGLFIISNSTHKQTLSHANTFPTSDLFWQVSQWSRHLLIPLGVFSPCSCSVFRDSYYKDGVPCVSALIFVNNGALHGCCLCAFRHIIRLYNNILLFGFISS